MPALVFAWLAAAAFAASLAYFLYAYLFLYGPPPTFAPDLGLSTLHPAPSTEHPALLWNGVLFAAFAFHHSLFARTGIKSLVRSALPAKLERAVYTMVASALFWLVCWAWMPIQGVAWALPGIWRWVGFGAQGAGIVMTLISVRALDMLELAGVRQVLPEPPRSPVLKTNGVYGFVRHPLYFAWILMVFGTPGMTMTRFVFAVISTAYLAVAIPFEERSLIETFGRDYASYRKKVRWRMLPGVY